MKIGDTVRMTRGFKQAACRNKDRYDHVNREDVRLYGKDVGKVVGCGGDWVNVKWKEDGGVYLYLSRSLIIVQ